MALRVAINGFGRIGRGYLRASLNNPNIDVVAANDLTSTEVNAHLLRYDSTQGQLDRTVTVNGQDIVVGDETVRIFAERNPGALPWKE
ncbi:MAG: glyceraldehyde 3-phosphate dehydrogenase NAD-binding domain-containing protein, partial [Acidimicrobiales bacterium]